MTTEAGTPSDGSALRSVHDELLRIEAHWTMQLQNQQARIATVLTLNTGALTFLGGASFLTNVHGRSFDLLVAALVILTVALLMGTAALVPWTPIGATESRWLDAPYVWDQHQQERRNTEPTWMVEVCRTLADDQRDADHRGTLERRRWYVRAELVLMCVALAMVAAAAAVRA